MDFHNYLELLKKVDDFFSKSQAQHQEKMLCQKGCHSCCKAGLSISKIEKEYIKTNLNPSQIDEIKEIQSTDPHQGQRCRFLDPKGACSIYPYRPVICRSHGIPVQYADNQDKKLRDVCELNFKDIDLYQLDNQDVLNIDTLNVLLATLNMFHYKEEQDQKRYALDLDSILS